MQKLFIFTTILAALSGSAHGQGQINTLGLGAYQCRAVLERLIGDLFYLETIAEWSFGYYTGANMANIVADGSYKDITPLTLGSYADAATPIISRCRTDPNRQVVDVAEEVYGMLPDAIWR